MSSSIDSSKLKKQLIYRLRNRGSMESCWILSKLIDEVEIMSDSELVILENFSSELDDDIFKWTSYGKNVPSKYILLIDKIKKVNRIK